MMKNFLSILILLLLLSACAYRLVPVDAGSGEDGFAPMQPGMGPGGMTWGSGSFDSLGEQIYFTGINAAGEQIPYQGGPVTGMMMRGYLSCASCHGPDARGGLHTMHMQTMDAPNIRWEALSHEAETEHGAEEEAHHTEAYDLEAFHRAVVEGEHPDGEPLSSDMPRWQMTDEELAELFAYLQSLE
jgi:hypothetical protein